MTRRLRIGTAAAAIVLATSLSLIAVRSTALAATPAATGAQPAVSTPLPTQVVTGARIAAVAGEAVHRLIGDPDRAAVAAGPLGDQRVPVGRVTIAAGTPTAMNRSFVSLPVTVAVDGRTVRVVYASYRIASYVRVVVSRRDLPGGILLGRGDLAIERVPEPAQGAGDVETLIGRRLNAAVARGTPIALTQTSTDQVVRAGQPALLIVRDGPVALAADVVARTSGGLGDEVAVFNPRTNTALSGIVTGPGRVELTLAGPEPAGGVEHGKDRR